MKQRYVGMPALIALALRLCRQRAAKLSDRAVRWSCFSRGGAGDLTARIVAQKFSDAFGQTFVVDNRPAWAVCIAPVSSPRAARRRLHAAAKGITTHGIGPHVYSKLPYDPVKDFTPSSCPRRCRFSCWFNAKCRVKSVSELIALARQSLRDHFASPERQRSAPRRRVVQSSNGIPSQHIPYKGSATAAPGSRGGQRAVHVRFDRPGHLGGVQFGPRQVALPFSPEAPGCCFPDVRRMADRRALPPASRGSVVVRD